MNSADSHNNTAPCRLSQWWVSIPAILAIVIGGFWLAAWFTGIAQEWSTRFITPKTNAALVMVLAAWPDRHRLADGGRFVIVGLRVDFYLC